MVHDTSPVSMPYTGFNVQHWLGGDETPRDNKPTYEGISCPACTRLHFIDRVTGKTLHDDLR